MCKSMCSYSGIVRIAVAAVASTSDSSRSQNVRMGGVHEVRGTQGKLGEGLGLRQWVEKRETEKEGCEVGGKAPYVLMPSDMHSMQVHPHMDSSSSPSSHSMSLSLHLAHSPLLVYSAFLSLITKKPCVPYVRVRTEPYH